ncbi:MAG: CPBP family intramembrane metalloprotease [Kiritimatiellae bacterium]|nr:CPBP family intramembrane metalloprotease [Kiritimatiellia bacterium]
MKELKFTVLKACPAITAATLLLCFLTQAAAKLFGIELPEQANLDFVLSHAGFNVLFMKTLALILVVMPAVEETIFRYVMFSAIKPGRAWLAAAVSSALFSASHYIGQPFPDNAFVALFFFGYAQCMLLQKTGKLRFTILNHALFNLVNLVLLFAFRG